MLLFVWLGFWVLLFVSFVEDIRLFAFHLFSYNMRIADRLQDVLMTVRASSAHGMRYKKKVDETTQGIRKRQMHRIPVKEAEA